MDFCDLSFDSMLMVPETITTGYSHHIPMSHVHRSTNQVVLSHCNIANGTITSTALQPNTTAIFQPNIRPNTTAVPQPDTSMFQSADTAMPHSASTSGTAKYQADGMGQPLSPKYKKVCVSCSALDMMLGYRKVTADKVYFDPSRLKLLTLFSIDSFFFTSCTANMKDWSTLMCHTACVAKDLLAFYSHFNSTQFLALALKLNYYPTKIK